MKSAEEILKDPHAKIKKSAVAALMVGIGVLALVVFSVFGWLLQDFLIFDLSRTQSKRELSRIRNEIAEAGVTLKQRKAESDALLANEGVTLKQRKAENDALLVIEKDRLQKLIQEIADHDAKMAQKRDEEIEYQELMAKIGKLKNDISEKKKEYESVTQEVARNNALKTDNETLEREKLNLKDAVSKLSGEKLELQRQKSELTTEVASLKQQQIFVKGDMVTIQEDINRLKNQVPGLKNEVDALTNRIKNLKKTAPSP